jgi:hypothetical protein
MKIIMLNGPDVPICRLYVHTRYIEFVYFTTKTTANINPNNIKKFNKSKLNNRIEGSRGY